MVIQIRLKCTCAVRVFSVNNVSNNIIGFENSWQLYYVRKKYKHFPSYYLSIQKHRSVNVAACLLRAFVYTFKESRILLVEDLM